MKLIVGLGNPEEKYNNTFHNLGFSSVNKTAKLLGVEFNKTKGKALIAETKLNGEKVILAKPQTYMNLSGESVVELMNFFKVDKKDLLVIYDDFDLDKGVIRIRENGSAGTHNGMKNIIALLGYNDFARVRVGFNPGKENKIPLLDLVLSKIKGEDEIILEKATETASKVAYEFAKGEKLQAIMQKYNGKA